MRIWSQFFRVWPTGAVMALLTAMCLSWASPAQATGDYLQPEQAFRVTARMADEKTAEVTFVIAKGYYLYREQFAFNAAKGLAGKPAIPPGKVKFDDTFQKDVETYRDTLTIPVPVPVTASEPFTLNVSYQGCADAGLCYSPMTTAVQ